MKTIKNIILSITLVALTTTSFGQLSSIKDRLFNKQKNEVEYITAEYTNETSRIEIWMHDLRSWSSNRASRDVYVAPVVTSTFTIDKAEVVYDNNLEMENWMSSTFECAVAEEALYLESWMSVPFESSVADEILNIEDWMITPFEAADVIEMESWMADTWV